MSRAASAPTLVHPVEPTGERWTDWLFSFVWLRLALYLAFIHSKMPQVFANGRHLLEYMDDHSFYNFDAANARTVLQYHQLPAWSPYWCGGNPSIAGPEDNFFAPDTILRLLFDPGIARHLLVVLSMLLAAEGVFRVARAMGSSGLASLGAGMVCAVNSTIFPLWFGNGFLNFGVGFGLMPWVVWCVMMGVEKPAYRYLGGFFLAWIFAHAGTYATPYTILLVGFMTFAMMALEASTGARRWFAPFVSAIAVGLLFALIAQAKFLPLVMFLKQFSRSWMPIEQATAPQILSYFTQVHVPLLILAALAVTTRDRWAVVCILGGGLFFAMSMGDFDPLSPYHLLKQLPLFKQLRSPERHIILVMFFLSLGAARFVTFVEDGVATALTRLLGATRGEELPRALRPATVLLGTLCAAALFGPRYAQMLKEASAQFSNVVFVYEPPLPMAEQEFRQHRGNRRDGQIFPAINAGDLACITGIPIPQSRLLRGDLRQEEYPLDPTVATVRRVRWTPNEITLEVNAQRSTRVLINQNWHKLWRADGGTVVSHQGLLAVDVPAGRRTIVLRYVDRPMQVGIVLSLLALAGLGVLAVSYLRRWLRDGVRPFRDPPEGPSPSTPRMPTAQVSPVATTEPAVEPEPEVIVDTALDGSSLTAEAPVLPSESSAESPREDGTDESKPAGSGDPTTES